MFNISKLFSKFFPALLFATLTSNLGAECKPEDVIDSKLKSTVKIDGSDSVAPLLKELAKAFNCYYPSVSIEVGESGSNFGPKALLSGTVNIASMSRAMSFEEIDTFIAESGKAPGNFRVAVDPIKIIVNRSNPISSLSIAQIDAIFSEQRLCGAQAPITSWQQIDPAMSESIVAIRRDLSSGTAKLFANKALCEGEYGQQTLEKTSFEDIVESVASNPHAIGYAPLHLEHPQTKLVKILVDGSEIQPTAMTSVSGQYPITRTYNLYYIREKIGENQTAQKFLRYIRSRRGTKVIKDFGLVPIQ